MNARCLTLPAVMLVLLAATWSPAGELPQAPAPRVKKTNAELLVGRWRCVEINGVKFERGRCLDYAFTPQGEALFFPSDDDKAPPSRAGTYKLDGQGLELTHPSANNPDRLMVRRRSIKSISATSLSLHMPGRENQRQPDLRIFERWIPR